MAESFLRSSSLALSSSTPSFSRRCSGSALDATPCEKSRSRLVLYWVYLVELWKRSDSRSERRDDPLLSRILSISRQLLVRFGLSSSSGIRPMITLWGCEVPRTRACELRATCLDVRPPCHAAC